MPRVIVLLLPGVPRAAGATTNAPVGAPTFAPRSTRRTCVLPTPTLNARPSSASYLPSRTPVVGVAVIVVVGPGMTLRPSHVCRPQLHRNPLALSCESNRSVSSDLGGTFPAIDHHPRPLALLVNLLSSTVKGRQRRLPRARRNAPRLHPRRSRRRLQGRQ